MSNCKSNIRDGAVFNRWTLLHRVYENDKLVGWLCRCECGTERIVGNVATIANGKSSSCGCLRKQLLSSNNPMFHEDVRLKVSASIKADPKRQEIIAKAVAAANTQEIKEKRKNTNQIRYGGNSPAASQSILDKMKATNMDRYGGSAPASNKAILRKMANTCMQRFGVENIMHLPEYRELVGALVSEYRRNKGIKLLSDGVALVDACQANIIT